MDELNLNSVRAQKARLSSHIGKLGFEILVALSWLFGAVTVYLLLTGGVNSHAAFAFLSITLLVFALAIWDKWDLQKIEPIENAKSLDDILDTSLLAEFKNGGRVTPRIAWQTATKQWQAHFLCNHLVIDPEQITQLLPDDEQKYAFSLANRP
jgi:hypothetical protein